MRLFASIRSLRFVALLLLAAASYQLSTTIGASSAASPMTAPVAVTVSVSPINSTTPVSSTKQFTATVTGGMMNTVSWSLIPPAGVNPATIGTIDATGKYTAPANVLANFAAITVKATSVDDNSVSATTSLTVRNQIPYLTSVTPNQIPFGAFTLTLNGSRFVSGAQATLNGSPLTTNFISTTQLTATGTASQAGSFSLTVINPGPGAVSSPATVTVSSGITVSVSPLTTNVQVGATQQFTASVGNSANQSVTWAVLTAGGGTISPTGLYTAPGAIPVGGTAIIQATSLADNVTKATATVTLQDPLAITNGRFLDQATFGVTPANMAYLNQIGIPAFIEEQLTLPESSLPTPATATKSANIDAFINNAISGQDQLRQRTIFALSEIIVIAMNKNTNANEISPWLALLSRNAFGNYRTLLKEITLDASMGKYLDLANSGVATGGANENYPREVMQLFSIGLNKLNQDGSPQLDAQNQPIPTYTQTDVQQLALALTGWTYSNVNGTTGSGGNYNYYPGPMIPVPGKHNTSQKVVLGQTIPANQTIQQDLDSAIDALFNHPNVGPFLATRLIRALVTSNPSPAYIAKVADAFNNSSNALGSNNLSGVRGDMKAVIRTILLYQDARNDTPPSNFGRLRTPVQHTVALARSLGINIGQPSQIAYIYYGMGEGILDANSVFSHYSPMFRIPKSGGLFGPEFQIYTPSEAVNRANLFNTFFANPYPINPVLQPFVALAGTSTAQVNALINAVDNALLYGRMSPQTRAALQTALPAMPDNNQRVMTAIYLTVMSGDHLIQH